MATYIQDGKRVTLIGDNGITINCPILGSYPLREKSGKKSVLAYSKTLGGIVFEKTIINRINAGYAMTPFDGIVLSFFVGHELNHVFHNDMIPNVGGHYTDPYLEGLADGFSAKIFDIFPSITDISNGIVTGIDVLSGYTKMFEPYPDKLSLYQKGIADGELEAEDFGVVTEVIINGVNIKSLTPKDKEYLRHRGVL